MEHTRTEHEPSPPQAGPPPGGEFVIPTIVTYEIMNLHAFVSYGPSAPETRV